MILYSVLVRLTAVALLISTSETTVEELQGIRSSWRVPGLLRSFLHVLMRAWYVLHHAACCVYSTLVTYGEYCCFSCIPAKLTSQGPIMLTATFSSLPGRNGSSDPGGHGEGDG